jgi:hypothetical protein
MLPAPHGLENVNEDPEVYERNKDNDDGEKDETSIGSDGSSNQDWEGEG